MNQEIVGQTPEAVAVGVPLASTTEPDAFVGPDVSDCADPSEGSEASKGSEALTKSEATDQSSGQGRTLAHGQTGPKTAQGKRKAARNALRHGLYAPSIVCSEAEACRLQTLRESLYAMTEASEVDDHPLASVVIESIAMLHIRLARVQAVETEALANWFANLKVQEVFCEAAALPRSVAVDLPFWYCEALDAPAKRKALEMPPVVRQAKLLLAYPQAPQGLEQAPSLAALRAFARETFLDEGESLAQGIVRHFEGGNFAARVRDMVGWLEKAYAWELRWGAHAVRYEAIIARLRAEAFNDILANDARLKLYASLHKQLLQQMALFEQLRVRAFLPEPLRVVAG